MLHIIWVLLKIIGWILLAILAILILLLCIVLFTAVRYQAEAVSKGGKDSIKARVRVSWFFRLVQVAVRYDGGKVKYDIRILKKRISNRPEKKETVSSDKKGLAKMQDKPKVVEETTTNEPKVQKAKLTGNEPEVQKTETAPPKTEVQKTEAVAAKTEAQKTENVVSKTEVQTKEISAEKTETQGQNRAADESKIEKASKVTEKLRKIKNKILSFFQKIKYTLSKICDKMKSLSEKKEKVLDFFRDEVHKKAFQKGKNVAIRLLKILKPKHFQAHVVFGFEDPSVTGKVLAGAAILYPFTGEGLELQPDFEQAVLKGKVYVKGKLRPISFLVQGLRLLLDKRVRKTWHDARSFMDASENAV